MGGRQKKKSGSKGGKKKPAAKRAAQQPEPEGGASGPTGFTVDVAGMIGRAALEQVVGVSFEGGGDLSFEEMLQQEKEAGEMTDAQRQEREELDDLAVRKANMLDELQRAHEAHAALWVKLDRMTPNRDEWHVKWRSNVSSRPSALPLPSPSPSGPAALPARGGQECSRAVYVAEKHPRAGDGCGGDHQRHRHRREGCVPLLARLPPLRCSPRLRGVP